jgi:hypothetical protein
MTAIDDFRFQSALGFRKACGLSADSSFALRIRMSLALISISGGLRLRLAFFCTRGLAGHVARIVMELSRLLFTPLLLIWILVVAHVILL